MILRNLKRARAKHDYERRSEIELSLAKGARVYIIKQSDNWWYLESNGVFGYGPPSYIKQDPPDQQGGMFMALALYESEPLGEEELYFAEGEEVLVVEAEDPDWWYGISKDLKRAGYFPCNYVEKVIEKTAAQTRPRKVKPSKPAQETLRGLKKKDLEEMQRLAEMDLEEEERQQQHQQEQQQLIKSEQHQEEAAEERTDASSKTGHTATVADEGNPRIEQSPVVVTPAESTESNELDEKKKKKKKKKKNEEESRHKHRSRSRSKNRDKDINKKDKKRKKGTSENADISATKSEGEDATSLTTTQSDGAVVLAQKASSSIECVAFVTTSSPAAVPATAATTSPSPSLTVNASPVHPTTATELPTHPSPTESTERTPAPPPATTINPSPLPTITEVTATSSSTDSAAAATSLLTDTETTATNSSTVAATPATSSSTISGSAPRNSDDVGTVIVGLDRRLPHEQSLKGASDELEFISDDELTDAIETDGSGGFGRSEETVSRSLLNPDLAKKSSGSISVDCVTLPSAEDPKPVQKGRKKTRGPSKWDNKKTKIVSQSSKASCTTSKTDIVTGDASKLNDLEDFSFSVTKKL